MGKLSTQVGMVIALAVLAAIIVFAGPAACNKIRSMAAQGRVSGAQAGAQQNSAADAVNAVAASGAASAASEQLTRSNEKEIRDAKGSTQAVDPAVRDAGLTSLCRRDAYRNDPKCRLQQPHP